MGRPRHGVTGNPLEFVDHGDGFIGWPRIGLGDALCGGSEGIPDGGTRQGRLRDERQRRTD
jgi:hypothetical protein